MNSALPFVTDNYVIHEEIVVVRYSPKEMVKYNGENPSRNILAYDTYGILQWKIEENLKRSEFSKKEGDNEFYGCYTLIRYDKENADVLAEIEGSIFKVDLKTWKTTPFQLTFDSFIK